MENKIEINEIELAQNPTTRIPVCLCLDVSGSMNDTYNGVVKIDALNEGIQKFYNVIKQDNTTKYAADISIVTFDSEAHVYDKFSNVDSKPIPYLKADGGSAMGMGIKESLDLLLEQKKKYKEYGIDYYQPWLVIISDGEAGDMDYLKLIIPEIRKLQALHKLTVMPVGVGDLDMTTMNSLSFNGAVKLETVDFASLFEFLSQSIENIAQIKNDNFTTDNQISWEELLNSKDNN